MYDTQVAGVMLCNKYTNFVMSAHTSLSHYQICCYSEKIINIHLCVFVTTVAGWVGLSITPVCQLYSSVQSVCVQTWQTSCPAVVPNLWIKFHCQVFLGMILFYTCFHIASSIALTTNIIVFFVSFLKFPMFTSTISWNEALVNLLCFNDLIVFLFW